MSTTSPKVAAQASKCSSPRLLQSLGVEESLHRVHLDHRVGNRRAGGERHAVAGVLLAQVTGFHVHVECPLAAAGLDAGDALHLGRRLQVLEIMGLVDEDVIDPEFVEHQPVILLLLGKQVFQAFRPSGLLFLDGLDEIAVGSLCAGVLAEQLVIFGDLLHAGTSPDSPATCRSARSCYGSR